MNKCGHLAAVQEVGVEPRGSRFDVSMCVNSGHLGRVRR